MCCVVVLVAVVEQVRILCLTLDSLLVSSGSAGLRSGPVPDQVHRRNSSSDLSRVQLGLRAWLGSHHLHVGRRDPLLPADGRIRGCNVLSPFFDPRRWKYTHKYIHTQTNPHTGGVLLFFTLHTVNVYVSTEPISLAVLLAVIFRQVM